MWLSLAGTSLLYLMASEPTYRYVEDTSPYVGVRRGQALFLGKLNSAGAFVPDCRWRGLRLGTALSSVPHFQIINLRRPGRIHVYEYRSGRLIKGELDEEGNFVPDLGSQVIDLKDYHYSDNAPRIYNLPGRFEPKK